MSSYGMSTVATSGRIIQVSSDGEPLRKVGGVTIDWATVTAVSEDTTLPDGTVIYNGDKYIRYGTILTRITQLEVQAIDLSGNADPTGGTWTVSIAGYGTTTALAYNISGADLQTALEVLVGAGNVTVVKSTFVYTLTFSGLLENVPQVTVDSTALTSGGSLTIGITTTTQGTASFGKVGPYASGASDGRQTLTRGECTILNKTVLMSQPESDHPDVIEGGLVYKARITDIATNPSWANILTAFPSLRVTGA